MTTRRLLAAALFLAPVGVATAQSADSAAIIATAREYIEAVWESDSARLRRVLHPELVKRQVLAGRGGAGDRLSELNTRQMLIAHGKRGDEPPPANRKSDVRLLHSFGNMATVLIDAGLWVDYLHLARWNGEYRIFNIMFDFRREP